MMMKKHILFFWGCVCLSLSLTAQTTTADTIRLTLSMDTITLFRFQFRNDKHRVIASDSVKNITHPSLLRDQDPLLHKVFYITCCCIK